MAARPTSWWCERSGSTRIRGRSSPPVGSVTCWPSSSSPPARPSLIGHPIPGSRYVPVGDTHNARTERRRDQCRASYRSAQMRGPTAPSAAHRSTDRCAVVTTEPATFCRRVLSGSSSCGPAVRGGVVRDLREWGVRMDEGAPPVPGGVATPRAALVPAGRASVRACRTALLRALQCSHDSAKEMGDEQIVERLDQAEIPPTNGVPEHHGRGARHPLMSLRLDDPERGPEAQPIVIIAEDDLVVGHGEDTKRSDRLANDEPHLVA